jgi:endonuclease YncB( thermonuclease family)
VGKTLIVGRDVCLEQLTAGLAWHYKKYEKEQSDEDRRRYAQAEVEAKSGRKGLWVQPDPQPPWSYRKQKQRTGDTR